MHKKKTKKKESNPTISLYRYDKLINEIFKRIEDIEREDLDSSNRIRNMERGLASENNSDELE